MYREHFGLVEAPFRITPHTEFFFAGANRGAMLDALVYAVVNDEGIVKVSGEVGSGKTMLCRMLMERLPAQVVLVYLANPSLSKEDIVFALAEELGLSIPENARVSAIARALQDRLIQLHGEDKKVVVLIDEAHAMPLEALEEIRLLSNLETPRHKLLKLVLFGQPELDEILARSDMRQLKERITHNFALEPLPREDVEEYIDFRMRAAGYRGPQIFSANAIKLIADASKGLTRRINVLAEKSLLAAYAEGLHQVTPKEVDAAIRDSQYERTGQGLRGRLALGAGAAIALGFGALGLMSWQSADPAPTVAAGPSPAKTAEPGSTISTVGPASPSAALPGNGQPAATPDTPGGDTSRRAELLVGVPPSLTVTVRERIETTRQWIQQAPDQRWFIQLTAGQASELGDIGEYLALADRLLHPGRAGIYIAKAGKDARIGIIYGDYPSRQAANNAIDALPEELRTKRPFARKLAWLKQAPT